MKKLGKILIFLCTLILCLSGCGKEENYNYDKLGVKTIVNTEKLTEQFDEAYNTVYFYPKTDTKSYLYIIKETDRDEYSLDTASQYLSTMKDILKNGYRISKKETKTTLKMNKQYICTYEYSALDSEKNIYTAKTKYIYDVETKDAIMVICFIDDKEEADTKEAFLETFNKIKLNKD